VWLYMLAWMLLFDQVKLAILRRLGRGSQRGPRWYERFLRGRPAAASLAGPRP
jgi:hypothetical protein